MTRISPGVARTALGLNLKHATFFLTHPGVVVDDEDHHGELQPEQEVEVAPALGHGAGLSRGQLLHLLPSSAGPSPSSSLNYPASPGAPTHYYLQYSEGIINQRLYPPSCGVASWCPCCAAVCLLLVRPGSCAGWCAPSKPPRHQGTIAHQQRFLVRTRTRQHTEEWGNADTHSHQYVNTHYTHALLQ